jgi:hypothetical protein
VPAMSEKQRWFMAACAHDGADVNGKCPSKKVAREFSFKPKGGYKKKKRG